MEKILTRRRGADIAASVCKWGVLVVLLVYCLTLIYPLVWMLLNSLKDEWAYTKNLFGLPDVWMWENFAIAFRNLKATDPTGLKTFHIGEMFLISVFRSGAVSFIMVFFQAICSYVLAKYKFVGNRFIYSLGIVVMILPIIGSMPSAMLVAKAIGTYDNLWLSTITAPSNIFGLNFLILYGAHKAIPKDFSEAAFMDGASHSRVLFQIMLPMVIPTCAVIFVLNFLANWNDYSVHLIWLPSYPNLALGLYLFQRTSVSGIDSVTQPQMLAGFAIVMIPTVLLYLASQNLIVSKFTVGGLKG